MALAGALAAAIPQPAGAASCASLASLTLPNVRVTLAEDVAAGRFVPPPAAATAATASSFADLPAFCRVAATIGATTGAPITIEVWLPASATASGGQAAGWNGRLRGIGNDGFYNAAPIGIAALANALRSGYAAVGSDGGRQGDASYVLRQPDQLTNYSYRATHEMTVAAKAFVTAFYGRASTLSLVAECAGRSASALSSIQRFPADYDAAAVGEFIGDSTRHMANQWWVWQALHKDQASAIPPEKFAMVHRAVLAACDVQSDGLRDGIVGDPTRCQFDPIALQCKTGDAPDCLTAPQVQALRTIYAGATNPRTGARVAPPLTRGSELNWGPIVGSAPNPVSLAFFKYFVLRDPNWDYTARPVNFDADIALADRQNAKVPFNLTNPDVRAFVNRGGKLLVYAGWNDPFVPPGISIDYYNGVVAKLGKQSAQNSVRLFMVPGMRNCPGTAGAENVDFDPMAVLQQWRESGKAPDEIVATRFQNGADVGRRPLCAYPRVAVYNGSGDERDARSFSCRLR